MCGHVCEINITTHTGYQRYSIRVFSVCPGFNQCGMRFFRHRATLATAIYSIDAVLVNRLVRTECANSASHDPKQKQQKHPHVDILIIGSGIVGSAIAYHLRNPSPNKLTYPTVTVVERGTVGCEATGLSAGTIESFGFGMINLLVNNAYWFYFQ